jgi:hypothetical protein
MIGINDSTAKIHRDHSIDRSELGSAVNAADRCNPRAVYRSEAVASDGATAIELKAGSVWLRWTVDKKLGILGARDCADDTHLFATIVNF